MSHDFLGSYKGGTLYDALIQSSKGRVIATEHVKRDEVRRAEQRAQADAMRKEIDLRKAEIITLIERRFPEPREHKTVLYWARQHAQTGEVIRKGGDNYEALVGILKDHTVITDLDVKKALGVVAPGYTPK